MNDRELLEMAAKACGFSYAWLHHSSSARVSLRVRFAGPSDHPEAKFDCMDWNPLTDDGDALRLAAHLCLNIEWFPGHNSVQACRFGMGEIIGWVDDSARSGSLRRAITVAAAKIGRSMP